MRAAAHDGDSPKTGFIGGSGLTLAPSTTYWVVVTGGAGSLRTTSSDAEDAVGATGWSIGDVARSRDAGSTTFTDDPNGASLMMRVNGSNANAPAAGTPTITVPNVFRVPAALRVDLSGITDQDGVTSIADTASYNWQRFDATGSTLEADSIGASPA